MHPGLSFNAVIADRPSMSPSLARARTLLTLQTGFVLTLSHFSVRVNEDLGFETVLALTCHSCSRESTLTKTMQGDAYCTNCKTTYDTFKDCEISLDLFDSFKGQDQKIPRQLVVLESWIHGMLGIDPYQTTLEALDWRETLLEEAKRVEFRALAHNRELLRDCANVADLPRRVRRWVPTHNLTVA